ncbi:GMC oxidoreductase [Rhodopirellula sp. MGV]|uniref:GMC oxidoreductase n=1 Tax=Rhodopirellula sp. MGV TaxID=2023130 RepID=UPI001304483D|nr:GMC oxidoreductase [Rhodopirellula sp. MGV]
MASDYQSTTTNQEFDYIIVGAGAGGAPLAARLVQAGKRVLVIEAGSNHTQRGPLDPGNEVSRVPLLHGASSEHPDLSWRFFVEHYNRTNGRLPNDLPEDPKRHVPDFEAGENESHAGIFYPRASGVGGCTIHNAMITIAGPDSDWDDIASYLGDPSWSGKRMRAYFQRMEHNDYLTPPDRRRERPWRARWLYVKNCIRFLIGRRPDTSGGKHGFDGWLHTSFTDLAIGLEDKQLIKMLKAALWVAKKEGLENAWSLVRTFLKGNIVRSLDPNHSDTQADSPEGVVMIPLAVYGGKTTIHQNRATPYARLGHRSSPRELLLETLAQFPNRLTIWTDCLVTKVLFDEAERPRVVGVELQRGERLYRAHVKPEQQDGQVEQVRVVSNGEVILCGGAFNTPQLLMLSGIGDSEQLRDVSGQAIPCRVNLPGVGRNLQDRYEVSVVSQMKKDFSLLEGATFDIPPNPDQPDPHLRRWREEGTGLYTSNGAVLGIFKRSRPELPQPDLFIFGIPSQFRGYQTGYSKIDRHNLFTWVILKSHTAHSQSGWVKLRSLDPRDTPLINFNYFGTGDIHQRSAGESDVAALLHGVKFVRKIADAAKSVVVAEEHPGNEFLSESAAMNWIRRDAWGHHACGTCKMGPDHDPNAVLNSRFQVRGVDGLRVVDASIFPKIPGYFIVSNLYMASEKAADVILDDAKRHLGPDTPVYPLSVRRDEAAAIAQRRRGEFFIELDDPSEHSIDHASQETGEPQHPTGTDSSSSFSQPPNRTAFPKPLADSGDWNSGVTGLALSGGGIRSATLSLGVLQSLARQHLLRRVDFMSTVSGGGYIGAFLGRFYDRFRSDGASDQTRSSIADQVEQTLVSPDSPTLQWLRSHGNYIAPSGRGDGRLNFAIFVRNLLSVHLVIGFAFFSVFAIANAIRYVFFDQVWAGTGILISRTEMPIGHLITAWLGPWFSPWFILVESLLLFLALPRIIGYWIVSQDRHESFKSVSLVLVFFVSGIFLYLGVANGLKLDLVILGLALLSSLIQVELAWARGRKREAAVGTGGVEAQRLRTRNYLTYDLGLAFAVTGVALAFTLIDSLGHALQEWKISGNVTYAKAFAALGGTIAALTPVARWLAGLFRDNATGKSTISHLFYRDMVAGVLGIVLFTLPLVLYCFAAHAVYRGGNAIGIGLAVTVFACIVTVAFALPDALTFVNRSSLAQTYSARLARAYLGASNPARHRPEGLNVTEVVPGDDVASIRNYKPYEATGPLHLINVTINQTLDDGSRLRKRDRQGMNMAISPLGVTIGEKWHSKWSDTSAACRSESSKVPSGLSANGLAAGAEHPLVDELGRDADRAEMLSLRQWIGISGAAVDPGRGRTTNMGTALLMGLVNLRTGYWWDSGIAEAARSGFPNLSAMRRFLYLVPRFFATQSLLIFEWLARYPGPWQRFWYLSDGGFFENLACYELIRRQVPRIIVSDGGADPNYEFSDFAELVRKSRIDFDARIEPFTTNELNTHVPVPIREFVGTLEELAPEKETGYSTKHAALFWVHYNQLPGSRRSVLLLLKASVTGDEPKDVRNYQAEHPEFPHESTADQVFDEAQWESYRKLGEHCGNRIFKGDWFWKIQLPLSKEDAS